MLRFQNRCYIAHYSSAVCLYLQVCSVNVVYKLEVGNFISSLYINSYWIEREQILYYENTTKHICKGIKTT